MMEHANLHHLQEGQLELSSSSSSNSSLTTTPSSYGAASSTTHGWSQNFNLNVNSSFCQTSDDSVAHSNINLENKFDLPLASPFRSSTQRPIKPYWNADSLSFTTFSPHEELMTFSRIKEELPDSSSRFTGMTNSILRFENSNDLAYIKRERNHISQISDKLPFKTLSSEHQFPAGNGWVFTSPDNASIFGPEMLSGNDGGCFGQMCPNMYAPQMSVPLPLPFDMNSDAMELVHAPGFSGTTGQTCPDASLASYSACHPSFTYHERLQSSPRSSSSLIKISSALSNENATESKRFRSCLTESSNKGNHAISKKSKAESRSTPPFKVRKEKLGDRVAALQQLVAPFGKTDTASVLMEAIGYIKFLQNQVENLSVPYMKPKTRSKNNENTRARDDQEYGKDALRSQGLCLVPLSCMSYVAEVDGGNVNGGSIWAPPDIGGGT